MPKARARLRQHSRMAGDGPNRGTACPAAATVGYISSHPGQIITHAVVASGLQSRAGDEFQVGMTTELMWLLPAQIRPTAILELPSNFSRHGCCLTSG